MELISSFLLRRQGIKCTQIRSIGCVEENSTVRKISLYWNDRIEAFAQSQGIVSVSLAESFVEYAEQNQTCLHGFENAVPCGGHWNEEGHRLAGERLAEVICELEGTADSMLGARPN